MAPGAKPDHKAAFSALDAGLAPTFLAANLRPHPVWLPGWDKHNAHYAAEYLAPPAPDGVRRLTLIYSPANRVWNILGLYHPCPDAAQRLAHGATLGASWADCLQGLPFRQNTLMPWKKRLFWRVWVERQVRFDPKGKPVGLNHSLAAIHNGWPEFWKTLNRPGTL